MKKYKPNGFIKSNGGIWIFLCAGVFSLLAFIGSLISPDFIAFRIIQESGGVAVTTFILVVIVLTAAKFIMFLTREDAYRIQIEEAEKRAERAEKKAKQAIKRAKRAERKLKK